MLALSALVLFAHPAVPLGDAWMVTVEGQLRPRIYWDSGRQFNDSDDNHEYVVQRTRLGVSLDDSEGLVFVVRLQDVRTWGEENSTIDATAAAFDVHEAYARVPLAGGAWMRLGRQEIGFDNERLVGAFDWLQRGRSFDGVRLALRGADWDADAFGVVIAESDKDPETRVPAGRDGGTVFGGAHGRHVFGDLLSASLAVYSRRISRTDEIRHTVGGYLSGAWGGLRYELDAYHQRGDLEGENLEAWLAGARLGYVGETVGLTLIADAASGDGTPQGVFDNLYGSDHEFYGELDYFAELPRHTVNNGLIDQGFRLSATPSDTVYTALTYHFLQSYETTPGGVKVYGHEASLRLDWHAMQHLELSMLYGVFVSGDAYAERLDVVAGDDGIEYQLYFTTDLKF